MKPKVTTRILKYLLIASTVVVAAIALIWIVLQGYSPAWTGFGDFTKPNGELVRGKTLWDWMDLFLIPLVGSIGLYFLNRSERQLESRRAEERAIVERQRGEERAKLEHEIATDRQQEEALQLYLDRITELLLEQKLMNPESEVAREVARIRTLTVLHGLDSRRKGMVIRFLHEARLIVPTPLKITEEIAIKQAHVSIADIGKNIRNRPPTEMKVTEEMKPIINLEGANLLGADLSNAELRNTNLSGADLKQANLQATMLNDSNLRKADLSGANLFGTSMYRALLYFVKFNDANLSQTNLILAHLHGAELNNANLQNTYMESVDLSDAKLTHADLSSANLKHARMEGADLSEAKLIHTNLSKGDLSKVNLSRADLTDADLTGAIVTNEQLATAKSLKGATMPDGTIHD